MDGGLYLEHLDDLGAKNYSAVEAALQYDPEKSLEDRLSEYIDTQIGDRLLTADEIIVSLKEKRDGLSRSVNLDGTTLVAIENINKTIDQLNDQSLEDARKTHNEKSDENRRKREIAILVSSIENATSTAQIGSIGVLLKHPTQETYKLAIQGIDAVEKLLSGPAERESLAKFKSLVEPVRDPEFLEKLLEGRKHISGFIEIYQEIGLDCGTIPGLTESRLERALTSQDSHKYASSSELLELVTKAMDTLLPLYGNDAPPEMVQIAIQLENFEERVSNDSLEQERSQIYLMKDFIERILDGNPGLLINGGINADILSEFALRFRVPTEQDGYTARHHELKKGLEGVNEVLTQHGLSYEHQEKLRFATRYMQNAIDASLEEMHIYDPTIREEASSETDLERRVEALLEDCSIGVESTIRRGVERARKNAKVYAAIGAVATVATVATAGVLPALAVPLITALAIKIRGGMATNFVRKPLEENMTSRPLEMLINTILPKVKSLEYLKDPPERMKQVQIFFKCWRMLIRNTFQWCDPPEFAEELYKGLEKFTEDFNHAVGLEATPEQVELAQEKVGKTGRENIVKILDRYTIYSSKWGPTQEIDSVTVNIVQTIALKMVQNYTDAIYATRGLEYKIEEDAMTGKVDRIEKLLLLGTKGVMSAETGASDKEQNSRRGYNGYQEIFYVSFPEFENWSRGILDYINNGLQAYQDWQEVRGRNKERRIRASKNPRT